MTEANRTEEGMSLQQSLSSKDVLKELNDVAADAQLVGYQSPAQNALLRGAAEIKFLRAELWTVAQLIFENASSDDAKHWARRITVSIKRDEPPAFAIAPDETTSHIDDKDIRMFLGWLSVEFPELHSIETPRLGHAWEKWRALMDGPSEELTPAGVAQIIADNCEPCDEHCGHSPAEPT